MRSGSNLNYGPRVSHSEHNEHAEPAANCVGDLTVAELVQLAIALDVPAADLLRVAVETEHDDDSGTRR